MIPTLNPWALRRNGFELKTANPLFGTKKAQQK
jgi:hypothetical protein